GFTANRQPVGLTVGPDRRIWFAEFQGPGGIGAITPGPGALTGLANGIDPASATVKGSVSPNGQLSVYQFDYGRTPKYGAHTTSTGAGSGLGPRAVSARLSGLAPNTRYHYRLTATNAFLTTFGADRTFRTLPLARLTKLRVS